MIRGIHHVGIHTPNLDRLKDFYQSALGFEVVGEEFNLADIPEAARVVGIPNASARVVMMRAHNIFIEIFEWTSPAGEDNGPLKPNGLGYTHFMVDVCDIDAEYERLTELGMTFANPSPVRHGTNSSVYGYDPDGNIIELGQIPEGALHLER